MGREKVFKVCCEYLFMTLDEVTQRILDDTKLKFVHFIPIIGLENYGRIMEVALTEANETLREKLERKKSVLEFYNWIWLAALGSGVVYFAYLRSQYLH